VASALASRPIWWAQNEPAAFDKAVWWASMTEADRHVLKIENHDVVTSGPFGQLMEDGGEMAVGAVEMKRCGECSVGLATDNDVIVAKVLAA
jgi:hypothetical protein